MSEQIVGIAEAKNQLSELINRAAYGGERIIIGSRGKPKAAIVSIADLQKLDMIGKGVARRPVADDGYIVQMSEASGESRDFHTVLANCAALRQRIARERDGKPLPDSVEDIRQIRLGQATS